MNQIVMNFEAARSDGEMAAQACNAKAQRVNPDFSESAAKAILAHLHAVGQASGEVLTDIAIAAGAKPHDQRAFGAVFASLSRKGLIRTVAYCARLKGHGTSGGRVWVAM
jgi:hypothetical protein